MLFYIPFDPNFLYSFIVSYRYKKNSNCLGVRPSTHQFSARDCLDIAEGGHYSQKYVRMQEWLQEAYRLMHNPMLEHRQGDLELSELYEYMGWGFYLVSIIILDFNKS